MSGRSAAMRAIACSPSLTATHLDVLARERQLDDALNRDAVVGEQELVHVGIGRSAQMPDPRARVAS